MTEPARKAQPAEPNQEDELLQLNAVKYLCFQIDEELYGFELQDVQEIVRDVVISRVPNAAEWVRGVTNLRGRVTPILDLRERLGAEPASGNNRWIVVLEIDIHGQQMAVGALVDSLPEVIGLHSDQIQPRKERHGNAGYVVGLGKIDDKVVLVLNPSMLVGEQILEEAEE